MDLIHSILEKELPTYICPWCHSECQYTEKIEQYVEAYDENPRWKRINIKRQPNMIYLVVQCNNCVGNNYNYIVDYINNDEYPEQIMKFKDHLALFQIGIAASRDQYNTIAPKFSVNSGVQIIQETKQLANMCRFAKFIKNAILFHSKHDEIKIARYDAVWNGKPPLEKSVDRYIKKSVLRIIDDIIDDIVTKMLLIHYGSLINHYIPHDIINIIAHNIIAKYLIKIIPPESIPTVLRYRNSNNSLSKIITHS